MLPVILLMVSDISCFLFGTAEMCIEWAAIDMVLVAQYIVYCFLKEINARLKSLMEKEKIVELLKLSATQHTLLNFPIS